MENDRDKAIRLAKELFDQKQNEGLDFRNGACLHEEIMPDWCVDIGAAPFEYTEMDAGVMCDSYNSGKVHHFVELDPYGNLINAE